MQSSSRSTGPGGKPRQVLFQRLCSGRTVSEAQAPQTVGPSVSGVRVGSRSVVLRRCAFASVPAFAKASLPKSVLGRTLQDARQAAVAEKFERIARRLCGKRKNGPASGVELRGCVGVALKPVPWRRVREC